GHWPSRRGSAPAADPPRPRRFRQARGRGHGRARALRHRSRGRQRPRDARVRADPSRPVRHPRALHRPAAPDVVRAGDDSRRRPAALLRHLLQRGWMDAHEWTYRVSAEEARREGGVADDARPDAGQIPDRRRFVTLAACGELQDAALVFALAAAGPGGQTRWYESDGGRPEFRVARSGCFRSAVALPPGEADRLVALRLRAHTRLPREGEPPLPPGTGRARLTRINKLFLLGEDDEPAENLFGWAGKAALVAEGPPLELVLARTPR